jgi:hypothetical protein
VQFSSTSCDGSLKSNIINWLSISVEKKMNPKIVVRADKRLLSSMTTFKCVCGVTGTKLILM